MSCCCTCVSQDEVGVVTKLGEFSRLIHPGFQWLIPCMEQVSGSISTRIKQLDVACEVKTLDNVFVNIVVSVQYQPLQTDEAYFNAFFKLTNIDSQMRPYVFDTVRSAVPQLTIDQVFELKNEIGNKIKAALTDLMGGYGYRIVDALVTDVRPDHKVKVAMNEINAARRLRVATQEKAEAEKMLVVKAAEADAESKYLQGLGIARQRQAIVSGLRDSVQSFSSEVAGTDAHDVMDMMVLTQYFDMLREVGMKGGGSTLMLSQNPGAMCKIANEIRQGFLEKDEAPAK
uniref:Band 7 domain-containing protein n=1 Tax=Pyramimonas obovata TaxID=1411642 RepID=A0A7S0WIJ2_9CHLO|mmetsp:Transcript_26860/g.58555  ORF Transcript_26860/g.58555 Transcript_26860/m.58555 type:complete len:287 (+) Transcript_26860:196-1056(+)|eukprot:CAMPEP_0118920826 /NCGR_PEP_ID=MMETSP1169-20130426/253_1 /TAXON_ID=36882 /ORGANISM="Pyramimonas obovata, Strain CCMP722" /LENGTH=286 /DNA_ID=CAMNT_0006861427 /DNA_START=169 /DNA_END=1029 /DNA_ORIENTATION=+